MFYCTGNLGSNDRINIVQATLKVKTNILLVTLKVRINIILATLQVIIITVLATLQVIINSVLATLDKIEVIIIMMGACNCHRMTGRLSYFSN